MSNRDSFKDMAKRNEDYCKKNYSKEIEDCINNKMMIRRGIPIPLSLSAKRYDTTTIEVQDLDSVSALVSLKEELGESKRIAILNFASYINPGGGYINGMRAQEESLCQQSFLYDVLSSDMALECFYKIHEKEGKHQGCYSDDSIYIEDVYFWNKDKTKIVKSDVITVAAPNRTYYEKYNKEDKDLSDRLNEAMESRIYTVLSLATLYQVDGLILGAYGCGVFRNDANKVATIFKSELGGKFNKLFEKVVFAIPSNNKYNFKAFKQKF